VSPSRRLPNGWSQAMPMKEPRMTANASTLPEPQTVPSNGPSAIRRLLGRKLALVGLVIMVICIGGAIFAPLIAPFDPNEQFFDGLTIEGAPLAPGATYWFGTDL